MTSSYLENKISEMKARLKAENETFGNDFATSEGNPFGGSRPGSGRRPKLTLDGAMTPTRTRKLVDLPGTTYSQPVDHRIDTSLLDQKMKGIMKMTGIVTIDSVQYKTDISDLELLGELGNGTCGHVVKMLHKPSQRVLAVKQMRRSGNVEENKRIAMDLEVVLMSHGCNYIVQCLGCFITESDVWICMELMGSCFDKLIKRVVTHVPEPILGKVTVATVKALHYLKENHGVMHRDVKPSNILIDERGNVKLCDFGISGRLVDSKAKSMNAGCAAYMSPERINPADPKKPDYDIRADVWSLGITLVELATGIFPYLDCKTDFEVLSKVMQDDPPSLPDNGQFSPEFRNFVQLCLVKDYRLRPKYKKLLEHPFIKRYETERVDVASWFNCSSSNQLNQSSSKGKAENKETRCFCGFNHEKRSDVSKDKNSSGSSSHVNRGGSQDWEKLKSVWNNLLKSPLFNRRKKGEKERVESKPEGKEELSRSPVSPLLLQRFLHQQIQHIDSVRSFRSPSSSPKYNPEQQTNGFNFDEAWLTERKRRGDRVSPPLHSHRLDQFGRHSSRKYRVSPSTNWLVRSKSMSERPEVRLPYVSNRLKNESDIKSQPSSEEQFQLELDELNRKLEDEMTWRISPKTSECVQDPLSQRVNEQPLKNFTSTRKSEGILNVSKYADDLEVSCSQRWCGNSKWPDDQLPCEERLQFRVHPLNSLNNNVGYTNWDAKEDIHLSPDYHKSLDDQLNQRMFELANKGPSDSRRRSGEHSHNTMIKDKAVWRAEDKSNARPISPSICPSPEPPPRINKRVSPLLARRIAYNNSRMARAQQSQCLSTRYHMMHGSGSNPNDSSPCMRSSSLPCSPVLSSKNYVYDLLNKPLYNNYTP